MRVKLVVVLEPFRQRADDGGGVGLWIDSDVITLEHTHESFRHSVRLWAFHGRCQRQKADILGEVARFNRRIARAIVAEPFDDRRQMIDPPEALLDRRHHEVAHVLALDPFGGGDMTHGLTIATVEREGDANFLGIVAGDLEAVRTPAQVRLCDRNLAVMAAFFMGAGMLTKKKSVNTHDAVDALAVDGLTPFGDRPTAPSRPRTSADGALAAQALQLSDENQS